MDEQWAEGVLQKYLRLLTAARPVGIPHSSGLLVPVETPEGRDLAEASAQTAAVVGRINGGPEPNLIPQVSDYYAVSAGEGRVRTALGRLRTEKETTASLGPSSPTMAADALHAVIWEAAASHWSSGHYASAVQRAATFLNAHVQDRLGRLDVSDADLMRQAFSAEPPQAGRPRLRYRGADDDQTVRSMRAGLGQIAAGAFLTMRNPTSHRIDEMPRQEALECLATLSRIARWVDDCELLTV